MEQREEYVVVLNVGIKVFYQKIVRRRRLRTELDNYKNWPSNKKGRQKNICRDGSLGDYLAYIFGPIVVIDIVRYLYLYYFFKNKERINPNQKAVEAFIPDFEHGLMTQKSSKKRWQTSGQYSPSSSK